MRRVLCRSSFGLLVLSVVACSELDIERQVPERGSVGEEMYGVLCDRLAAGALREDMTGESFRGVCHKVDGKFANEVDESKLPKLADDAVNEKGEAVSVAKQRADRDRAFARIRAFVKRRDDVIAAVNAALPDIRVAIKDLEAKDETQSCNPPAAGGEGSFLDQLAKMLGRFTDLYNDGTIPESTRSIGKVVTAFRAHPDAQEAYARLTSREGYRPASIALGMARPAIAYPRLRDMSNSLLYVIASDSDSFLPGEQRGIGYSQFAKLLEISHAEMLNATADPLPSPLAVTQDTVLGRQVISRPRDNLEIMQEIMLAQDAAFVGGDPKYIVKRDARGYAALADGKVTAPFVDKDGDGLPDVDEKGRFISASGGVPTPFTAVGVDTDQAFKRDDFGRATRASGLVYDYIDTNRTFVSRVMRDVRPLLNPDPDAHQETLMDALAGMPIMLGPRQGGDVSEKRYANGISVKYNAVTREDSPILDLIYAATQLMGDKTFDDVLQLAKILFTTKQAELARVVAAVMKARDLAPAHPEAEIPATSTFWDEVLDAKAKLVKEPGLLEDVLDALSQEDTAQMGPLFSSWMRNRDAINYNPANLNGPPRNLTTGGNGDPQTPVDRSKPDTGDNRSIMQRFLQLVADGDGVAVCNQDGAKVHARLAGINVTLPTPVQNPYKECEIFKIPNVATFFLQTIAGTAKLNLRDKIMRTGIIGIGAATTELMEDSSGITGFWGTGTDLRPKPEWAARLVFFDLANDSPNDGDLNYRTNKFLKALNGPYAGTNVCPERIIDDPCANGGCNFGGSPAAENDVASDGKVRGLRNCSQSDWIQVRNKNTMFAFEQLGFYKTVTPLVRAFVNHKREDVFTALSVAANKHWQSAAGSVGPECKLPGGKPCAKSGLSSYEAIISETMGGDLFPALQAFLKSMKGVTIKHCTAVSAQGVCTATVDVPAFKALADATRALVDPELANKDGLKDRLGSGVAKRNDGTTNPQVTPVYLLTSALSAVDAAYVRAGEDGERRKVLFRTARSRLADQFLGTTGSGTQTAFANPSIPKMTPVLVDVMRAQMWARCPKSFAPPYERCAWAKDTLPKSAEDTLRGPMFAGAVDVLDSLRSDGRARRETEGFLQYMLDATSQNDALASLLASSVDTLQVLRDDKNLIPFFKVLAEVVAGPTLNASTGKFEGKGVVDAQLSLLGKISGRYRNENRVEICSKEIDPNQMLPILLTKVMTPMEGGNLAGMTPLEVFIDVVAEVNRAAPGETAKLEAKDYSVISENVADFLLNKERGLEQFYEIVKKGTGR